MRQREAAIITIRKQEQEQGTDVCWTITLIINNLSEQMLLAFIAMDHWILNDMSFFFYSKSNDIEFTIRKEEEIFLWEAWNTDLSHFVHLFMDSNWLIK